MNQEYLCAEYIIGEQDILNSVDGLDVERIRFEKKIKFLILLLKFGTFADFGCENEEEFDSNFQITRTDVKKYLESLDINDHLDWINLVLPNMVVKQIKKLKFYNLDLEKKIYSDEEYINKINPKRCELIKKIYSTLNNDDKNTICKILFEKYSKYISSKEIFRIFLSKYGPKNNTDVEIKCFFDKFIEFNRYENKNSIVISIDEKITSTKSLFNKIKNITWQERIEFIKNNVDFYSILILKIDENKIREKIYYNFESDEKISFVDDYFNNCSVNLLVKISKDFKFANFFGDIIMTNEINKKFELDVKYDLLQRKYFNELEENDKNKLIEYKLDYNSHYELFKLDEKKYMKILLYNDRIDDYTFNNWDFDNFEFLNMFNDEVQIYLKKKIYSDSNLIIKNRHTPITSLDNYIDTMYFIHNPPTFLRMKDREYNPKYINLMDEFAKDFNFNFEKINYLNMKIKIGFEFV